MALWTAGGGGGVGADKSAYQLRTLWHIEQQVAGADKSAYQLRTLWHFEQGGDKFAYQLRTVWHFEQVWKKREWDKYAY